MEKLGLALMVAVAFSGFYLAGLRFLKSCLGVRLEMVAGSGSERWACVLLCFWAWVLAGGVGAVIPVWGYFLNFPLFPVSFINAVAGLVALFWGWPVIRQMKCSGRVCPRSAFPWPEKIVLAAAAVLLFMYLYRVCLPWRDHDETLLYGYLTKLMAGGWTFADIARENGPIGLMPSHLVQSGDARLYALVNDTYLVRFSRLLNFVFCGAALFAFLRIVKVPRLWALTGVAVFWGTPELSYLAVSLKVDAVVMMFEWGAFLALAVAFLLRDYDQTRGSSRVEPVLCAVLALVLSAFAFGNRFSGIISMGLSGACLVFFLGKYWHRWALALGTALVISVATAVVFAPGYWVHSAVYQNPLYPVRGPGMFKDGVYLYTIEQFKANWNITGLPPVLLQGYLLFALASGLELIVKIFPFLQHLPMAANPTESMGWPYPLLLAVLLWPLFRKSQYALNVVTGLFLFQFVSWSIGLHYSRLFLASSVLMIMAAMMMAACSVRREDRWHLFVQKGLKGWIILTLLVSFLLQGWWFHKRYFGLSLFGAKARYDAALGFLGTKDYLETEGMLTFEEARNLNNYLLETGSHPVVYIITRSHAAAQILFDKQIYVTDYSEIGAASGMGSFILVHPACRNNPEVREAVQRYFPVPVRTTPVSGWVLYTRAD